MASSQAERNKAYRIRGRVKKGTHSIDDAAWLERYELGKKPRSAPPRRAPQPQPQPPAKPAEPQAQPVAAPPSPAPSSPAAPGAFSSAPASEARAKVEAGFVPVSFAGAPAGPTASAQSMFSGFGSAPPMGTAPSAPTCNIPDCPACTQQTGLICEVTGKRVFPPMSIESARGLAEGICFIVGLIARMFRKDKHPVEPTKHELDCLAMGIREVQMRRANWLSAGSDFVMVWMGLGSYGKRAFTEKPKKEEKVAA